VTSDGQNITSILILEDEDIVGDIARQMLVYLGYDVVLVKDGMEAVSQYISRINCGERFHIVIMDLTIPGGMGGKEAVSEILAVDPNAKVVVSSGYSNDPIMVHCKEYGFSAAIAKPFDLQSLKSIVEALL
jgi:CheY-like chemotaxis protein